MASSLSLIIIMTFLSLAIFSIPSNARVLGLGSIGIVTGNVNCPSTTTVIPNAPVSVVCGNGNLTQVLASGVTDVSGVYFFVLSTADTLTFDAATCRLSVSVPPTTCTVNIPNGLLTTPFIVLPLISNLLGSVILVISRLL